MHANRHKHPTQPHSSVPVPLRAPQPVTTSGDKPRTARSVSADEIRLCAYRKWESAGRPNGDGIRFWLEAENELTTGADATDRAPSDR